MMEQFIHNFRVYFDKRISSPDIYLEGESHIHTQDVGAFYKMALGMSATDMTNLLEENANWLSEIEEPFYFASTALIFGAIVENGGSSFKLLPVLLDKLPVFLDGITRLFDLADKEELNIDDFVNDNLNQLFQTNGFELGCWYGFGFLDRATRSMLALDKDGRIKAQENVELCNKLAKFTNHTFETVYTYEFIKTIDKKLFYVFNPFDKCAYELVVSGVSNCFHLMTVLQAFLEKEKLVSLKGQINELVVDYALGNSREYPKGESDSERIGVYTKGLPELNEKYFSHFKFEKPQSFIHKIQRMWDFGHEKEKISAAIVWGEMLVISLRKFKCEVHSPVIYWLKIERSV